MSTSRSGPCTRLVYVRLIALWIAHRRWICYIQQSNVSSCYQMLLLSAHSCPRPTMQLPYSASDPKNTPQIAAVAAAKEPSMHSSLHQAFLFAFVRRRVTFSPIVSSFTGHFVLLSLDIHHVRYIHNTHTPRSFVLCTIDVQYFRTHLAIYHLFVEKFSMNKQKIQ